MWMVQTNSVYTCLRLSCVPICSSPWFQSFNPSLYRIFITWGQHGKEILSCKIAFRKKRIAKIKLYETIPPAPSLRHQYESLDFPFSVYLGASYHDTIHEQYSGRSERKYSQTSVNTRRLLLFCFLSPFMSHLTLIIDFLCNSKQL